MISSLPIPQSFELPSRPETTDRGFVPETDVAAGYVYLSVSPNMPDFVEIATSNEDPRGLKWSVQSMGGVTRFHCARSWRTSDSASVVERFREALASDQIPNHDDLFRIPLRFAQQILEEEVKAFPAPEEAPVARRGRKPYVFAAVAAVLALGVAIPVMATRPQPVSSAPAPKVEPVAKAAPALRHTALSLR